jgi:hypothetical protein
VICWVIQPLGHATSPSAATQIDPWKFAGGFGAHMSPFKHPPIVDVTSQTKTCNFHIGPLVAAPPEVMHTPWLVTIAGVVNLHDSPAAPPVKLGKAMHAVVVAIWELSAPSAHDIVDRKQSMPGAEQAAPGHEHEQAAHVAGSPGPAKNALDGEPSGQSGGALGAPV